MLQLPLLAGVSLSRRRTVLSCGKSRTAAVAMSSMHPVGSLTRLS